MKIVQKTLAVLGYLFLLSVLLHFKLSLLFDFKQIILVIFGSIILYLPSMTKENALKKPDFFMLANCGLYAGVLETFVLLFLLLVASKDSADLTAHLAQNLRPLLYGFCFWQIFSGFSENNDRKNAEDVKKKVLSASDCYDIFFALGLTRRETEVAIMVCQNKTNGEIAESLTISEATVKKHLSNIFEKLEINRREQLREYLKENSMIKTRQKNGNRKDA